MYLHCTDNFRKKFMTGFREVAKIVDELTQWLSWPLNKVFDAATLRCQVERVSCNHIHDAQARMPSSAKHAADLAIFAQHDPIFLRMLHILTPFKVPYLMLEFFALCPPMDRCWTELNLIERRRLVSTYCDVFWRSAVTVQRNGPGIQMPRAIQFYVWVNPAATGREIKDTFYDQYCKLEKEHNPRKRGGGMSIPFHLLRSLAAVRLNEAVFPGTSPKHALYSGLLRKKKPLGHNLRFWPDYTENPLRETVKIVETCTRSLESGDFSFAATRWHQIRSLKGSENFQFSEF
jgi:hypothetical protein